MITDQLNRTLQAWKLSDPQLLAETATSHVYTVTHGGVRAVLKLLTPLGVKDEARGAIALRHFDGHGAVRLLRADELAHLLEYADGDDLYSLVRRGEDDKATEIIAEVLNNLHSVAAETIPDGLIPLNEWFRELFKKADEDQRSG